MKIRTIHSIGSASSAESAHCRSKEPEQPKGSPKGLTQQPPDESEINPSRTTSLGGKRSWASDSDSDGQADPKKTPTQSRGPPRKQMLPPKPLPSAAKTSAGLPLRNTSSSCDRDQGKPISTILTPLVKPNLTPPILAFQVNSNLTPLIRVEHPLTAICLRPRPWRLPQWLWLPPGEARLCLRIAPWIYSLLAMIYTLLATYLLLARNRGPLLTKRLSLTTSTPTPRASDTYLP